MANEFIARNGITSLGNIVVSGSITTTGTVAISGSIASASFAATASSADNFLTRGTLTAQTLVVQTITSSVDFVTGSTRFGSLLANTHVFSGSVSMNPGGLFVSGSGLVGIGTTNPTYALDISGQTRINSTYPQLILSGSDVLLTMYDTFQPYAYSMGVGYNKNYAFEIIDRGVSGTSNSTAFIITGSYIGINTLSPAQRLDVASGHIKLSDGYGLFYGTQTQIYASEASKYVRFDIAGTSNVMFMSSSGNVGIGIANPVKALHIVNTSEQLRLGYDSGTTYTDFRCDSAGGLLVSTAANSYIINYISGSEKMRITNGTTNSQINFTNSTTYSTSNTFTLTYRSSTVSYGVQPIADIQFATEGDAASSIRFITRKDAPDYTERMRITNGGYLKASNDGTYLVSTGAYHEFRDNTANGYCLIVTNKNASPASTYIQDWRFTASTPNNTSARFWNCEDATAGRAYMRSNGGLSNYQANDTNLSDIRTKKDITPIESYWNKFKALEIVKFKYKDQTHDDFNIGVIAQQVEEVAPEFVDTDGWDSKDIENPLWSVYTADLHHATIKVLQEAMAKIETLEARVQELENK